MRVLVANAPRLHREAFAAALGRLRPGAEVVAVAPASLAAEVGRRRPDAVVCGRPPAEGEAAVPVWVQLYPGGADVAVVRAGGEATARARPTLAELAALLDRAAPAA